MRCQVTRFRAMGGPCELRLYAAGEARAESAAERARAAIAALEARYSRYLPDSLTTRINQAAGNGQWIEVDDETAGLLDYAAQAWQASDGLFDITAGVLRRAWDFRSGQLPAQEDIAVLLPLIGWQHVEWRRPRIRLPRSGMQLDFGGYVKEYAADAVAQACRREGIAHGLVELGGDVSVIGPHPDGSPWRVGIRHPRAPQTAIARVDLHSGALASSGDYERYMDVGDRRYCHVLNPKTGWPVQALAAVSVVAPQCLVAGTATTVAMLNEDRAVAWLQETGLDFLAVAADGTISGSLAAPA